MRKILHLKTGQALVEFALAATLIFFLLAAAVDLGLIFFAIQGLHNAAQEGAAYGSRWLIGSGSARTLNLTAIRDRVRHESGSKGGIGFVNLLDLNNDGTPDVNPDQSVANCTATICQKLPDGTYVTDTFIQIQLLADTDTNGDPMNDLVGGAPTVCTNPASDQTPCYIRVTVQLNYKTVFPLSPGFARTTLLHSSYIVRLRDAYSAGGTAATPAVFQTVTPVPTPTPLPTATPTPCTAPSTPTLSVGTKTGTSPNFNAPLSWTAVTGATQYKIYQTTGTSTTYSLVSTITAPTTTASIALSGSSGTINKFKVSAVNACGTEGSQSGSVSITK